jgi:hypothetical protein
MTAALKKLPLAKERRQNPEKTTNSETEASKKIFVFLKK